jgi:hypothetical protein
MIKSKAMRRMENTPHMGEMHTEFWIEDLSARGHLGDLGINGI